MKFRNNSSGASKAKNPGEKLFEDGDYPVRVVGTQDTYINSCRYYILETQVTDAHSNAEYRDMLKSVLFPEKYSFRMDEVWAFLESCGIDVNEIKDSDDLITVWKTVPELGVEFTLKLKGSFVDTHSNERNKAKIDFESITVGGEAKDPVEEKPAKEEPKAEEPEEPTDEQLDANSEAAEDVPAVIAYVDGEIWYLDEENNPTESDKKGIQMHVDAGYTGMVCYEGDDWVELDEAGIQKTPTKPKPKPKPKPKAKTAPAKEKPAPGKKAAPTRKKSPFSGK
jgi:hypothetical protein